MISVIIPVRNAENTVKFSIESVLNQGVEDIEILTIINGCSDSSEERIKSINDRRIKILHSEPGIVPALNEGIRRANGSLIARQDADDIWHQNKLNSQIQFLNKNKEIDILGTQLRVVDSANNHIRDTLYPLKHHDICKDLFGGINPIGHPSVIFKRKILDKCAGYFDLFPLAEDLDLWTRSVPWYRFANLPEVYVTYKHVPNPKYDPRIPKTLASWYKMIYGIKQ